MVRDTDTVTLYIDGIEDGTNTAGAAIGDASNSQDLYIGRSDHSAGPYYMTGSVDNAQIFDRSLTAAEILQLYQSSLTKLNTTHWNFFTNQTVNEDESYNYSATATDTAGNSNQTEMRTLTGPAGESVTIDRKSVV